MNANVTKTNTGKLLVAVLAMFMIVAGIAVVFSDSEVNASADPAIPTGEMTSSQTISLTGDAVGDLSVGVNGGTYNLSAKSPVTLTINMAATADKSIMFYNSSITVGTNVTLILNMTAGQTYTNNHILYNSSLTINGGTVEFRQSANNQGQTWYNDGNTTYNNLTMTGATSKLVFNGANGISGVVADVDAGEIDFQSTTSSRAALNFAAGSDLANGTTLNVDDSKGYIYVGGNTAFNGAVNAESSDLVVPADVTLTVGANAAVSVATVTQNGSITDSGSKLVSGSYSTSTIGKAIDLLKTHDEVTLEGANDTITAIQQIPAGKTLNIVDSTINTGDASGRTLSGDAKIIVVTGTLNLDNSYIFCGVYVDEEAGGIVNAINVHNLTSSGTMYDSTKVGFGDTLTLSGTVPAGVTVDVYGTLNASDVTINGVVNTYVGSTIGVTGSITVANQFNLNAGASMELSGTITVRNDTNGGAKFTLADSTAITYDIPGTPAATEKTATLKASLTVTDNGTFNVNRATSSSAANNPNSLVIGNGAEFVVEGNLTITGQLSGAVQDKGNVTFNGTVATGASASVILYDGITLTVTSVTGTLIVSDNDDVLLDYYGVDAAADLVDTKLSSGNSVTLVNVRGVTIAEAVSESYSDDNKIRYAVTNMTVTGSVSKVQSDSIAQGSLIINNACDDAEDADADVTVRGSMAIIDNFAVGSKVQVTVRGPVDAEGTINVIAEDAVMTVDTGAELTVEGSITVSDETGTQFNISGTVNAVYYVITNTADATETRYYTSFAGAVDNIANADEDTVNVIGTVKVSADDEVPSGATVVAQGKLVIDTGVTLTFVDGAVLNITSSAKDAVDVNGTLVINNKDTGLSGNVNNMSYDVYTLVGLVATYTSLANALADAEAGETITLSQDVTLDTSIVIPEGVTLQTGRYTVTVDDGVTITVNGTFAVQNGGNVVAALTSDTTDADARYIWGDDVRIVVNGVMSDASTAITDLKTYYISGAYYTARGVNYVTGVDYAAENVHEGTIDIIGQVTGTDMTFSSERNMTVNVTAFTGAGTGSIPSTTVTLGNVTIDGVTFVIAANDKVSFNGTITAAAADGNASVQLSRANGVTAQSASINTIDGPVDYLYLSGTGSTGNVAVGAVTVSAGTVTIASGISVSGENSIAVSSGATLVVPAGTTVVAGVGSNDATTLSVDGTMNVAGDLDITGIADVAGTVNIAKSANSDSATVDVTGILNITGTVAVSVDENLKGTLNIGASSGTDTAGIVNVGAKPSVLGTPASGSITGNIAVLNGASMVKVYSGASVDGVTYGTTGSVLADAIALGNTAYYINETEYMTVYALTNQVALVGEGSAIADDMVGNTNSNLQLSGLNTTGANTASNWFIDAAGMNAIGTSDKVGSAEAIYMTAKASVLTGTVSAGTGLVIYIDNVAQGSGNEIQVSYGVHVVTIDVKVGYDGANATITFNGQTIQSGDTITVTENGFTLTATGAVPADYASGSSSDGMGLTEILLIILVILIVVMAIMVALRLMRS